MRCEEMHTTIQGTDEFVIDALELSLRPAREHRCSVWPDRKELATTKALPAFLDTLVVHANRVTVFGIRYKPYWIMSDVAMAAALIYAWVFSIASAMFRG